MKKKLYIYLFITIAIAILIHLINYSASGFRLEYLLQWKPILIHYIYAAIIGIANILFFGVLNSTYSWEKNTKKMIVFGVIGSVVVSTLSFFIARVIQNIGIEGFSFEDFIAMEHISNYIFSMLIAFIITLIFHLFYFYKALQESRLREQKIITKESLARLQALKDQLDPHFLFNSLNVLTSLIEEKPENAQDFTTKLSKVYRYVLDQKEKEKVPLVDEINFANYYINLLKMRFENGINYSVDISNNKDYYLLPLSLQLALENVIKHNQISVSEPLQIWILIKDNMLVVKNTYRPKKLLSERKGVGLANIEERYKLFTEKKIKIEYYNDQFELHLPLLKTI